MKFKLKWTAAIMQNFEVHNNMLETSTNKEDKLDRTSWNQWCSRRVSVMSFLVIMPVTRWSSSSTTRWRRPIVRKNLQLG